MTVNRSLSAVIRGRRRRPASNQYRTRTDTVDISMMCRARVELTRDATKLTNAASRYAGLSRCYSNFIVEITMSTSYDTVRIFLEFGGPTRGGSKGEEVRERGGKAPGQSLPPPL